MNLAQWVQSRLDYLGLGWQAAEILYRDVSSGLRVPDQISANGSCYLWPALDGWVAVNLARPEDVEMLGIWAEGDDTAQRIAQTPAAEVVNLLAEWQIPVARCRERQSIGLSKRDPLQRMRLARVVDMSALWAGPLCGALWAAKGADVVRINSLSRPDPTEHTSPAHFRRLHGAKRTVALDLQTEAGRRGLLDLVRGADVLITSARADALARLGLRLEDFPHLLWVAITGHGWAEPQGQRVGFGDDCAAAGGLLVDRGGVPHFMGDALADPITGIEAALASMTAWQNEQRGLCDMAMAEVAAGYAAELGL